jgi:hypothetical protein
MDLQCSFNGFVICDDLCGCRVCWFYVPAEVLVNCGEQLEAMLVVPAPLVMLLAAQHLFFVISTLLKASAPPSLAVCTIWAVLQLGLPHVLVYRKRKWLTAASEAQCSCSSAQLEVETLHQPAAAASIHQSFATEAGHNSDRQAAVEVQLCLSQTPTALHGPPEHLHSGDVGPSGVSMLSSDRVARACTGNVQPTFTTSAEHQNNSTLQARAYATSCSPNQHHQRLAQYEEEFACDLEGEYVVQYDGDTYYPHYAGQPTATIEGHDQFSSSPLLAASDGSVTVSRAQRTEPAPCLTPALSAGAPSPVMSEGCLPAKRHHQQVQLDVVAPMPHPNQATPVMDTKTAAVGQPACWEPAPAWEPALADPAAAFLGGFDIEPTRVSAGRGSHRPSSRHYMSLEWLDTDPDEELAGSCSLQTSQVQLPPGLQLEQVPEHLCPRFLDDPKQQMDVKKGAEPAPKQLKFRSIQVGGGGYAWDGRQCWPGWATAIHKFHHGCIARGQHMQGFLHASQVPSRDAVIVHVHTQTRVIWLVATGAQTKHRQHQACLHCEEPAGAAHRPGVCGACHRSGILQVPPPPPPGMYVCMTCHTWA